MTAYIYALQRIKKITTQKTIIIRSSLIHLAVRPLCAITKPIRHLILLK